VPARLIAGPDDTPALRHRPTDPLESRAPQLVGFPRLSRQGCLARRPGAELFRALGSERTGCVRHRATPSSILLRRHGVPRRFVANEAHAFAEAWLPRVGWRRVDLGRRLAELSSTAPKEVAHRPRACDPFPRPPSYESNYSIRTKLPAPDSPRSNPCASRAHATARRAGFRGGQEPRVLGRRAWCSPACSRTRSGARSWLWRVASRP